MLSRRNLSQSSTGSGVGTPMRMQILTRAVRSQTWRAPSGPRSCLARWATRRGAWRMRLVPSSSSSRGRGGGGSWTTRLTWNYSLFRGRLCGRQGVKEGGGEQVRHQHLEEEGEVGEGPSGQPRRSNIMRIVEPKKFPIYQNQMHPCQTANLRGTSKLNLETILRGRQLLWCDSGLCGWCIGGSPQGDLGWLQSRNQHSQTLIYVGGFHFHADWRKIPSGNIQKKLFFSTANNLGIWKHFITFKGWFRILSARAFIWAISQCS